MATIWNAGLSLIFLFCLFFEKCKSETCKEIYRKYNVFGRYESDYVRTFHCQLGCCGPSYDEYCCELSSGAIVGIAAGVLVFIACIVTFCCCCLKKNTMTGRTIAPATHPPPNGAVFVHATSTSAGPVRPYPPVGYSTDPAYPPQMGNYYLPAPPPYSSNIAPPPVYSLYEDSKVPATTTNPFAENATTAQETNNQTQQGDQQ